MSTPKRVVALAKQNGAKRDDLKLVDTFGTWQHFSFLMAESSQKILRKIFSVTPVFEQIFSARRCIRNFLVKARLFSAAFFLAKYSEKADFIG